MMIQNVGNSLEYKVQIQRWGTFAIPTPIKKIGKKHFFRLKSWFVTYVYIYNGNHLSAQPPHVLTNAHIRNFWIRPCIRRKYTRVYICMYAYIVIYYSFDLFRWNTKYLILMNKCRILNVWQNICRSHWKCSCTCPFCKYSDYMFKCWNSLKLLRLLNKNIIYVLTPYP